MVGNLGALFGDLRSLKFISIVRSVLLSALVLSVSCSPLTQPTSEGDIASEQGPEATSTPVVIVSGSMIRFSMEELIERADLIVIARVVEEDEIVNTARNVFDPTEPSPTSFGIGQVYKVEVLKYLKGEDMDTLKVVQNQGIIGNIEDVLSDDVIDAEKQIKHGKWYTPPRLYVDYLMFLSKFDVLYDANPYQLGSYRSDQLYAAIGHPWLFELSKGDFLYADDVPMINREYPPAPLDEIVSRIENPGAVIPTSVVREDPYPPATPYP